MSKKASQGKSLWAFLVVAGVLSLLVFSLPHYTRGKKQSSSLSPITTTSIRKALKDYIEKEQFHSSGGRQVRAFSIQLRAGGRLLFDNWYENQSWQDFLSTALSQIEKPLRREYIDAVIIHIVHDRKKISISDNRRLLTNLHRGVHGVLLRYADKHAIYMPAQMIATNRSFARVLEIFLASNKLAPELTQSVSAEILYADQLYLSAKAPQQIQPMFRGNTVVSPAEVSKHSTTLLASGLYQWLTNQMQGDGSLRYKYFPSAGQYSDANNVIRQFLGSLALLHAAGSIATPEKSAQLTARRNINANFEQFYRRSGELGFFEFREKVKLGAAALGALALLEFGKESDQYQELEALHKLTETLWQPDGSFITFYKPPDRVDNQNFYPGEALLYWAKRYQSSKDVGLKEKFAKSFEYYRKWHRENQNPAFVPWHTQAYFIMWQETKEEKYRDFIFEMNDWLLGMQQWKNLAYPDIQGRFYDPQRSYYGPPHVSSTGVYLEGLIDAFRLAQVTGDAQRLMKYRRAILRGIRSLLQLQFTDEIDMFYIQRKSRVRGGLRTTVYDNTLRVDNAAHNLVGLVKILSVFSETDWSTSLE